MVNNDCDDDDDDYDDCADDGYAEITSGGPHKDLTPVSLQDGVNRWSVVELLHTSRFLNTCNFKCVVSRCH